MAFCALLHTYLPAHIPYQELISQDKVQEDIPSATTDFIPSCNMFIQLTEHMPILDECMGMQKLAFVLYLYGGVVVKDKVDNIYKYRVFTVHTYCTYCKDSDSLA